MTTTEVLPTVKIKTKNGPVDINLSDFNKDIHKLADASDIGPLKPLDPKEQTALYGSSIQPAGWTLPDGSTLQLGEVVAEAHKLSGKTVEAWNKLAQDKREKLIADMVAEMVPTATAAYTIGTSGRGAAAKFVVLDVNGAIVGEHYDTKEAAEAALDALTPKEESK